MAKYGVFLKPTTLDRIVVVKTTVASPADSDWDSQDGEVDFKGIAVKSLWAVEDGGDIHIATQQENGRVAYHLFDPGTDTWTIKNETVVVAGDTDFDNAPALEAVSIALRADGDIIVVAAYNDGTNERLRVFSEQGAGWTNEGEASGGVASTNYAGVVVMGPDGSDRISWAYKDDSNDDVDLRSISSGDVIASVTEVDSTVDTATILVGPGVIDSADKIYVPYVDADNKISVADWPSGSGPTVNLDEDVGDNTVYGQGRTTAPFVAACLAIDGTDVHLLYADNADQDLQHQDNIDIQSIEDFDASDAGPNDPGAVWGNDSNAFDGDDITVANCATNGSSGSNYLEGEGTDAPASGPALNQVVFRVRASESGGDAVLGVRVTADGAGETLLDTTQALVVAANYDFSLTTPSGGWTWAKIQALEVRFWRVSGPGTLLVARSRVVINQNAETEELDAVTVNRISCKKGTSDLLYFYDDGGTTKYGAITLAAPSGPPLGSLALMGIGR